MQSLTEMQVGKAIPFSIFFFFLKVLEHCCVMTVSPKVQMLAISLPSAHWEITPFNVTATT